MKTYKVQLLRKGMIHSWTIKEDFKLDGKLMEAVTEAGKELKLVVGLENCLIVEEQ